MSKKLKTPLPNFPKGTFEIFYREFMNGLTVEDWLSHREISEKDQEKYPNAKKAVEIKESPLYKALK